MTTQKTGSLIINLEQYKQPPKLATKVSSIKGKPGVYKVSVIHPNSKAELYSEEFKPKSKDEREAINEAMKHAITLLDKPELKTVETFYEEVLHIPQWKKGSMQLNTEEDSMDEESALPKAKRLIPDDVFEEDEREQAKPKKGAKKAGAAKASEKVTPLPKVAVKATKVAKKVEKKAPAKAAKTQGKAKKAVKKTKVTKAAKKAIKTKKPAKKVKK